MNYTNLKAIFELGRPITTDNNFPYLHFAYKYNKQNYRLISSGELFVRGRNLDIPSYIFEFLSYNEEVLMIANIVSDKVLSIVFRTIRGKKEFMKVGTTKSTFYGLGELDSKFKFGTPILLVEGHLDRDIMATIYPNTFGIMTSHLSKSQVELLTSLTNRFILMLDNDEAGISGQKAAKYQLKGSQVLELRKDNRLKDAGDLVKLDITNHSLSESILRDYKTQIELFI